VPSILQRATWTNSAYSWLQSMRLDCRQNRWRRTSVRGRSHRQTAVLVGVPPVYECCTNAVGSVRFLRCGRSSNQQLADSERLVSSWFESMPGSHAVFSITCSAWAADFIRMLYEPSMRYSHNAMLLWQLWLRAVNRPQSAKGQPSSCATAQLS
jgi:hypothetical protein